MPTGVDLGGQQFVPKPYKNQDRRSDDGKENKTQQRKHKGTEDLPQIFSDALHPGSRPPQQHGLESTAPS